VGEWKALVANVEILNCFQVLLSQQQYSATQRQRHHPQGEQEKSQAPDNQQFYYR
jgi:hypothetical protein